MKAALLRGAGQFACEDVPYPDLPQDGAILKVEACGICGSDLRAIRHGLRFGISSQVLGHEIAGVVVEVGSGVHDYAVGDRLAIAADVHCGECYYCQHALFNLCENWQLLGTHFPGGMAEYMQLPAAILRRGIVHRIPDDMPAIFAALAEPASSVIAAQQDLDIQPGEVVAIFGDGPIGALHLQVAQARGAQAILVGLQPDRMALLRERDFAALRIIDSTQTDVGAEILSLTNGRGADVAISAAPSKSAVAMAVKVVRKRGRVGLFAGLPRTDPTVELDNNRIHYDELRLFGTFSYHPDCHQTALNLIARKLIDAEKIITAAYPLAQLDAALSALTSHKELKVMLCP